MPVEQLRDQPEIIPSIFRPCRECRAPMLLMAAIYHRAGFITKAYECYVCKKTEEIMALERDVP